jgi:formylglycine-generating enzyme required for sulfatase activity
MRFVRIQPGQFIMGSPATEEGRYAQRESQHKVTLTKPFHLGIHHITRGQFASFVKDTGYRTDAEREGWAYCIAPDGTQAVRTEGASWRKPGFDQADDHPAVEVTWNDAQEFCLWLTKKEARPYRLPTEAEWEYACRAGTSTAFFWGEKPDGGQGFANCSDLTAKEKFPGWNSFNWHDGFVYTSPVGSFKPNSWGLYDMIGNALEWCEDRYGPYGEADRTDPTGPEPPAKYPFRVLRGGSWFDSPKACRSAFRYGNPPDLRNDLIGFRVCLDGQAASH